MVASLSGGSFPLPGLSVLMKPLIWLGDGVVGDRERVIPVLELGFDPHSLCDPVQAISSHLPPLSPPSNGWQSFTGLVCESGQPDP